MLGETNPQRNHQCLKTWIQKSLPKGIDVLQSSEDPTPHKLQICACPVISSLL